MKSTSLILSPVLIFPPISAYTINMSNSNEFNNFNQFINYLHYQNIDVNTVLNQGSLKNSDYEQFKRLQGLAGQPDVAPGLGILSQVPVVGSVTKPIGKVLGGLPLVGPVLEQLL